MGSWEVEPGARLVFLLCLLLLLGLVAGCSGCNLGQFLEMLMVAVVRAPSQGKEVASSNTACMHQIIPVAKQLFFTSHLEQLFNRDTLQKLVALVKLGKIFLQQL